MLKLFPFRESFDAWVGEPPRTLGLPPCFRAGRTTLQARRANGESV